jgi:parvulin-like peptidyl-prolyl isomerase
MNILRYKFYVVFAVLLMAASIGARASDEGGQPSEFVDGLLARVNDDFITVSDVLKKLEAVRRQIEQLYTGSKLQNEMASAFRDMMEKMIERELILDAYEEQERQIPEALVDERVEQVLREVFDGDRNALMEELSRAHLTFEEWRDEIREEMIVSFMERLKVDRNVSVSPMAVRLAYQKNPGRFKEDSEVKVSMIVLRGREGTRRPRVQQVEKLLEKGEKFASVAKKLSDGSKADRGGQWGWVMVENLRRELRSAIAGLAAGEVSAPVTAGRSTFFVKVEDRRGGKQLEFSRVREDIRKELEAEKRSELYEKWISVLRQKAVINKWDTSLF